MKKRLIVLGTAIVGLGVAYTAASWYTGNIIEKRMAHSLSKLVQSVNGKQEGFKIQLQYKNYDKGIFSTTFELTAILIPQETISILTKDQIEISDTVTINHGPFPWKQLISGNIKPMMAALHYQTSKESNEKLWIAADNQPFITVDTTIGYNENLTISAKNKPLTNYQTDKNITYNISSGHLLLDIDPTFTELKLNSSIDSIIQKNGDYSSLEVDKLSFSLSPVGDNPSHSSGQLHADNISLSLNQINQKYALTHLNYTNSYNLNAVNYMLDDALTIDKATFDINGTLAQINHLAATRSTNMVNKGEESINVNGKITTDGLVIGTQNLGAGEVSFIVNSLPANYLPYIYLLTPKRVKNYATQLNSLDLSLNKLLWKTAYGDIDANMTISLKGENLPNLIENSLLDESHLMNFNANLNIPAKVVGYIATQLDNTNSTDEITPAMVAHAEQSILMLSQLLLSNSPLVKVELGDNSRIYTDIKLSRETNLAEVNGQQMPISYFFNMLNK